MDVGAGRHRRGGGVFNRTAASHPELRFVNDGGRDAPLTSRGRTAYRLALLAIVALGFTLLALAVHH
jgi:hypothetical protein